MGNTKHTKEQIRERIQQKKILFDGAFGTYYGGKYDTRQLPELANLEAPERVKEIHREYLEAGAQILRTNTFAANSFCMDIPREQIGETLRSGLRLAREAVAEWRETTGETKEIYIAADIGQIPGEAMAQKDALSREYEEICNIFLEEGADFFVFETFSEMEELLPAIKMIGEQAFITVQFSVNQFGYSNAGLSARKLLQRAGEAKEIDAVGFNCGVGPSHMHRILQILEKPEGKLLTALPNAGYPQMVTGRMLFTGDNKDYFVDRMQQMTALGVDMAGGCCGTTPEYIAELAGKLDLTQYPQAKKDTEPEKKQAPKEDRSFYHTKEAEGRNRKLIAVELAPPMGIDDEKLMDAAHLQQLPLHNIALLANLSAGLPALFAVQSRIYILSAGKQDTVHHVKQLMQLFGPAVQRKNHRNAARLCDAVQIPRNHPNTIALYVIQRCHANHHLSHYVLLSCIKKWSRRFSPAPLPLVDIPLKFYVIQIVCLLDTDNTQCNQCRSNRRDDAAHRKNGNP